MNLVVDIGNTRTKVSVFDGDEMIFSSTFSEITHAQIYSLKKKFPELSKVIVSAVKDYFPGLKPIFESEFSLFIELGANTPIPIKNRYKSKETLGNDRLAAVVGANYLFPAANILVVDAGTAITFDFIDKDGNYLGGNISPGINMRFLALNRFTGKLPLVEPGETDTLFGDSTESAIKIGIRNGILYEVSKTVEEFMNSYENLVVVMTGGDAPFFEKKLKCPYFVNTYLVSIGLNRILNFNG